MTGADAMPPPRQVELDTPPEEGNTTPSGCACHPSTGGELTGADAMPPPRQVELDTPPEEGNTTPSGCACHPSTGGELTGADAMRQPQCICTSYLPSTRGELTGADAMPPPRQVELDTPPEEGNTTPSGCACHPSKGGELAVRYFFNSPSVSVLVISSPQEGN